MVNSQVIGKEVEDAVDGAIRGYAHDRLCQIDANYPKFARINGNWVPTETGLPDRSGTVWIEKFSLFGVSILFDIKSIKQANTELLERAHQYWYMIDHTRVGAIGGYLCRWYGEDFQEWRWHWACDLDTDFSMKTKRGKRQPVEQVRVNRMEGLLVPTMVESLIPEVCSTPNFLPIICKVFADCRDIIMRKAEQKRR
jgi:hypothetical protein